MVMGNLFRMYIVERYMYIYMYVYSIGQKSYFGSSSGGKYFAV